jgi:hypothetical protein
MYKLGDRNSEEDSDSEIDLAMEDKVSGLPERGCPVEDGVEENNVEEDNVEADKALKEQFSEAG